MLGEFGDFEEDLVGPWGRGRGRGGLRRGWVVGGVWVFGCFFFPWCLGEGRGGLLGGFLCAFELVSFECFEHGDDVRHGGVFVAHWSLVWRRGRFDGELRCFDTLLCHTF